MLHDLLLCGLEVRLEALLPTLGLGELRPQLLVGVELRAKALELVLIALPEENILETEHEAHLPDEVLQADDLPVRLTLTLSQGVELNELLLEVTHLLFKLSN